MKDNNEYKRGFMDALKAYAWWNNGEEQVGTCGTTLKKAIENVEQTWNYNFARKNIHPMNKTATEWYEWIEQQCHDRQKQHEQMGSHPLTYIQRRITIMALQQAINQSPNETVPTIAIEIIDTDDQLDQKHE